MYEQVNFVSAGKFVSREEWLHPSRTIDSHELIIMLCGTAHMFVGSAAYDLTAGDVLHLPPGLPHGGTRHSAEPVSFYWIHFTETTDPLPPRLSHPNQLSSAEILCKQLLHCVNSDGYPSQCADYYVRILLMELLAQERRDADASDPLCAALEAWVRGSCDRPIKVADAAAHFQFNADYLSRVFRRYHPEGLKAYIDAARCQRIKQDLASTDQTLQEIAQKYGFSDYKYFLKYFRFHEGLTPTEYRKAYYNTHINRS